MQVQVPYFCISAFLCFCAPSSAAESLPRARDRATLLFASTLGSHRLHPDPQIPSATFSAAISCLSRTSAPTINMQQGPYPPQGPSAAGFKRKLEDGTPGPAAPSPSGPAPHQPAAAKQRPPMPPPYMLASLVPESEMFADLLKMEQKLDWTMLRKKAEAQDALGKPIKVSRARF